MMKMKRKMRLTDMAAVTLPFLNLFLLPRY